MKHLEDAPLTAQDICWLLRAKFQRPQYAIVFQVSNTTGNDARRHADAIVMDCFPSRGLSIHGIEIKISREDLKREIRTPEKAEPIAAYCDTWNICVPKSLNLTGLEVASNWGIYEAEPGKITLIRNPMRMDPKPVDRRFLAALLRADGIERDFISNRLVADTVAELEAGFERRLNIAIETRANEASEEVRWMKRFLGDLDAEGIKWPEIRWREPQFVQALKAAMNPKKFDPKLIEKAIQSLEKCAGELKGFIEEKAESVSTEAGR